MKKVLMLMILVSVAAEGCKKDAKPANTADDIAPAVSGGNSVSTSSSSSKKEVATGDMKDLLLALKRVHFAFDSSTLNDEAKSALDEAAEKLRNHPEVALYVDGHTDAQGTTEYNMSLGDRRADAVVSYLNRSGVESKRLTKVSFGEESPLVKGGGEMANAENRRVEYRLMRGEVELVLEETAPIVGDKPAGAGAPDETASAATPL
jgi:peptidoglycan-associated lipoprotein